MGKKSWIVRIMMVAVLLMILTGCSQRGKSSSANEKELEDISIMLDWYPNAVHSSIYYAKEKGLFEEEGLNVTIEMPAETNDPLKLAAIGKVDLAISYQMQVALSRSEEIPVVSLAAFVRHSLNGIMYKKESGITSPKDLENKTVGFASSEISQAVVETMVETDGGDPSKVKMMDVGWDLMPALATDNVDALTSAYINHELVILRKEGYDIEVVSPSDYGVPESYELIIVTGEETLKKKKPLFEKFWRALAKGQEAVKENPEAGLQVLLDHENNSFPLDKKIEAQSLEILLPLMDAENLPFGYQEEESWEAVIDWLVEKKIIQEKYDTKDVFENIMSK
ncbi:ABC transporter substrate-binding protein [Sporosarcina sp. ANT_H38]|uniref:ABC transporter substrate-binding protein n=1 Tax=Sporosarcina sp. ANT_H38 TaxID=2597358 RepID=UPI0011F2910E|nr:ABC transporter substrate-binding protein [Sporosarcina sp. ANT_H38]KAA0948725.1 ABC transporter substrate-binding protein [Sporosarcina sp. ANT_H38]